jgi:hypothetical protein
MEFENRSKMRFIVRLIPAFAISIILTPIIGHILLNFSTLPNTLISILLGIISSLIITGATMRHNSSMKILLKSKKEIIFDFLGSSNKIKVTTLPVINGNFYWLDKPLRRLLLTFFMSSILITVSLKPYLQTENLISYFLAGMIFSSIITHIILNTIQLKRLEKRHISSDGSLYININSNNIISFNIIEDVVKETQLNNMNMDLENEKNNRIYGKIRMKSDIKEVSLISTRPEYIKGQILSKKI